MYSHFRTYNVATALHYHLYLLSYQCGTCLWYINYDLLFHQNSSKRQNQWQSNNVWPFEFISASLRSLPDFYRFVENWFGFILIHDKYRLNVKICWECKFVGDEYPRNQQKLSTTTTPQYPVQYRVPSPSYFQNYIIPSDIIALLERKEQKYTE